MAVMDMRKITILVLTILLSASCQWIEQPADSYLTGYVDGCVMTFVAIAGPPPSDAHMLALVEACTVRGLDLMHGPIVYDDDEFGT